MNRLTFDDVSSSTLRVSAPLAITAVVLTLAAACGAHLSPRAPERLEIAPGEPRRIHLRVEAGEAVELAVEPLAVEVEVEVDPAAGEVEMPVWHDGRRAESGVRCPPGRVTTLRWVDGGAVAVKLRAWSGAAVVARVSRRPATADEVAARDAHRRLAEALPGGDDGAVEAAVEAAVSAVDQLFGEDSDEAVAYLDGLNHRILDAGLWDVAVDLGERALARRRPGGDAAAVADLLSSLSTARFYRGEWAAADALESEALAIRRVLGGEDSEVARSLMELAAVSFLRARYRESARRIGEALAILDRDSTDPVELAEALHTQAEILREQGRFDDAEAVFRRAIGIWESVDREAYLYVRTLYGLAKILRDRGQYVEWDRLLTRARVLLDADPETAPDDRLRWMLHRAELMRLGGRFEDAEPLYRRQLATARQLFGHDNPELFYYLNQTAVFLAETGRLEEAAALFDETQELVERTLDAVHPLRAQVLDDLGALERLRGDAPSAADAYRRGLEIREKVFGPRHVEVAISLTGLAEVLADVSGGEAEALDLLDRAVGIFRQAPLFPEVLARALALRARLLDRGGRREEAIAVLAEALAVVEGLRSTAGSSERSLAGFFGGYRELYHRMVGWRLDEGRPDLAFEVLERSRGRAFLDQLAANQVDLLAGLPPDLRGGLEAERQDAGVELAEAQAALALAREDAAVGRHELAELEARVVQLAQRLQEVETRIRAESPVWRDLVTRAGRPAGVAEVQAGLLGPGRMLVAYELGRERSFVFVVRAEGPLEVFALELDDVAAELLGAEPGPLTAAVVRAAVPRALPWALGELRGLAAPAEAAGGADDARHGLWRALVPAALRSRLAAAREVVVVPDGALHRLPLEILAPELPGFDGAASYWLDDGPVLRYGLSATILVNLERRQSEARPGGQMVMVTDPLPAEGQGLIAGSLRRLPGTAREGEAISAALSAAAGAPELRLLTGREARESSLRRSLANQTRILHVATHGLVEEGGHELLAALALTPPAVVTTPDDDGLLQLHEIYRLDLPAELAVLSACETSRGREVEGEGAFALSRGFLVAGASRVVASLWSVDDASTADLMTAFYRGLLGDGAPLAGRTAGALRDAKRQLRGRAETADPFYWAGFVLAGSS